MHPTRRDILSLAAVSAVAAATPELANAEDTAPPPAPPPQDRFKLNRDWTGANPISLPEPAWELLKTRFHGIQVEAPLERRRSPAVLFRAHRGVASLPSNFSSFSRPSGNP